MVFTPFLQAMAAAVLQLTRTNQLNRGLPRACTAIPLISRQPFSSSRREMSLSNYLVTPAELNEALKSSTHASSKIIPLCASWFLPNDPQKRTGYQTYLAERIPNARFFDLDAIKDNNSPYPHMLSTPKEFAAAIGRLGISDQDTVVVYDTRELGIFSAPRVAWNFKIFGHEKVHILNNFRLWVDQGLPTESGDPQPVKPVEYTVPQVDEPREAVDFETMKLLIKGDESTRAKFQDVSMIDARPKGRWAGSDPEPRPGLPSGHMPGSKSIPFSDVLDPNTKAFLPKSKLKELFEAKGVDMNSPVISSCGTGVTAVVLDTALVEAGMPQATDRYVYDGSWTEWAMRVRDEDGLIEKTA